MNPRRALLALVAALPLAVAAAPCPAPLPGGEDWPGQKHWLALEQAGLRFGRIEVVIGDIYESNDAWYARSANLLHLDTRSRVVEQHLLVKSGDPVQARRVYESLRELRALGIFRAASFEPIGCADGKVDARVAVDDAWTLILSARVSSVGGQTASGIKLEDRNFLGSGKEVFIERTSDATRSSVNFAYDDPALFGSDWRLWALHADQSDGTSNHAMVRLPFLSLEQAWAFEFENAELEQDVLFYQDGGEAWRAESSETRRVATAWRLIGRGADSAWRLGFGARAEERAYGALLAVDPSLRPPPTLNRHEIEGFTLALNRIHDHWASFQNLALFDRVEDLNLGLDATLHATVGERSRRYGIETRWSTRVGRDGVVSVALDGGVRDQDGDWQDGLGRVSALWYDRSRERRTSVVRLALDWRADPDPEHEVSLGGIEGLLGYPAHWVVGDRAWRLHLEERGFTDKVLFQTLKVGWSVVLEAGAARRIDDGRWSGTLADLGAGLRLGNLRGAYGQVLYFTLFTPLATEPGLDRVQFVVGDVIYF